MLRSILGSISGLVIGIILIGLIEVAGHLIWPPPDWMDATNPESIRRALPLLPLGALLSVTAAWILGAFVGSWIGCLIARGRRPALVVGLFIVLSALATLLMIPHPIWFWIVALVLVPLAAYFGGILGSPSSKAR